MWTSTFARSALLGLLASAAVAVAGCDDSLGPDIYNVTGLLVQEFGGVVLLTQNVTPQVTMDALYEGRVEADGDGCLRIETPEAPTVVWPRAYDLEAQGDLLAVVDGEGATVGFVGGTFSLAGGEVTELTDAMGFSADDRARAEERCPGRYWIVG